MKKQTITISMTGNDLFAYWANMIGRKLIDLSKERL
jgi:hypothetical protein